MTEREAWLWLAAMIKGAPEMLVHEDGRIIGGLCACVHMMRDDGLIGRNTCASMIVRIESVLGLRFYLHIPHQWRDGVRRDWCLRFAEECE